MTNIEFVSYRTEMILKMSKSQITTKHKQGGKLRPMHPGAILQSEFLEPLNLSATKLALYMGIAPSRVTAIVSGERSITADTALRLARVFSTSVDLWLHLQSNYEVAMLDYTGEKDKMYKESREFTQA